jgi:hypothetical protein
MRTKLLLATLTAALLSAGAATANNGHLIKYSFLGQLTATPGNGGVSITVQGGNKVALRAMLGAPVTQTFAYGDKTEFLKWSQGKPAVVDGSTLAAGDYVWVHVRAPRGASLGDIEQRQAGIVGDHGTQLFKPDKPLYLFRGTIQSVATGTVTVDVRGGNHRALKLLVGQSKTQTFAYGESTIFLLWQGKVPTVIDATKLTTGDKVVVRIRAAAGSSLAQVTSTAANRFGEHEPPNAK